MPRKSARAKAATTEDIPAPPPKRSRGAASTKDVSSSATGAAASSSVSLLDAVREVNIAEAQAAARVASPKELLDAMEGVATHCFGAIKSKPKQGTLHKIAEILLDAGVPVDGVGSATKSPWLMLNYDQPELTSLLLSRGIKVDTTEFLRYVATFDFSRNLAAFMEHESTRFTTAELEAALLRAAWCGSPGVVRVLLDKGVNPNAVDQDNKDGLNQVLAASKPTSKRLEIVKLLVEAGCDTHRKDSDGKTLADVVGAKVLSANKDLQAMISKK